MQRLEVSGAVRPIYGSLGLKRLSLMFYYVLHLVPSIQYNTYKDHFILQLYYTWRHVSAVKRPSSGQYRRVLLRYSQNCLTTETCRQV